LVAAGARQSVVVTFGPLDPTDAGSVRNAGIGLIDGIFGPDSAELIGIDQQAAGGCRCGTSPDVAITASATPRSPTPSG
jgi:hypothetical protein